MGIWNGYSYLPSVAFLAESPDINIPLILVGKMLNLL